MWPTKLPPWVNFGSIIRVRVPTSRSPSSATSVQYVSRRRWIMAASGMRSVGATVRARRQSQKSWLFRSYHSIWRTVMSIDFLHDLLHVGPDQPLALFLQVGVLEAEEVGGMESRHHRNAVIFFPEA